MQRSNSSQGGPVDPKSFEVVYVFEERFNDKSNALYIDEADRLFMAEADSNGQTIIGRNEVEIPIEKAGPDEFRQVSLVEALEWFSELGPKSNCGYGDTVDLCRLAAKQLRRPRTPDQPEVSNVRKIKTLVQSLRFLPRKDQISAFVEIWGSMMDVVLSSTHVYPDIMGPDQEYLALWREN